MVTRLVVLALTTTSSTSQPTDGPVSPTRPVWPMSELANFVNTEGVWGAAERPVSWRDRHS